jgi:hypothetical protein
MDHVSDMQILELLGGHMPKVEQERLQEHIAVCADCQNRLREYEQTWSDLAEAVIDTSGRDLLEGVISGLPEESRAIKFRPAISLARIAASILLAVFLGHVLGKYSAEKPDPQEDLVVAKAMFLDVVLAPSSKIGWSEPVQFEDLEEVDSTDEATS